MKPSGKRLVHEINILDIHIHHQRQDPTVYPLNFAEGLPLYFRDHDGPPMPVGGVLIEGETVTATGDLVQHIGK